MCGLVLSGEGYFLADVKQLKPHTDALTTLLVAGHLRGADRCVYVTEREGNRRDLPPPSHPICILTSDRAVTPGQSVYSECVCAATYPAER